MIYVETDFLLALAKETDWLRDEAETALEDHDVATSVLSYAELLLIADDFDFDRVRAVANLIELVPVVPEEHAQAVLKAAKYQEEDGMTAFDALHVGMAETWDSPILSSEQDYDALDIDRYPLEPDAPSS